MDEKTRRVAGEIVEAGLRQVEERAHGEPSWDFLNLKFLALGNVLADVCIASRAHALDSARGSEQRAVAVREKVALDLHRSAASVVKLGGDAAVMALLLAGGDRSVGIASLGSGLREDIAEDGLPDKEADSYMESALRDYVLTASALYELNHVSDDRGAADSFVASVTGVISFAVAAAASARAIESPVDVSRSMSPTPPNSAELN